MADTVLLIGQAQMPRGGGDGPSPSVFTLELLVTRDEGRIVDLDFWGSTVLSRRFLVSLAEGYCLKDGPEGLMQRIRRRMLSPNQGAMIQSLRVAHQRWQTAFGTQTEQVAGPTLEVV